MKKYLFLFALIFTSYSYSFQITGESFKAKFKIDSITVGKSESTINLSSADVGQYGVVYVSYTLTSNPNIPNSGTWTGYGRGISPEGVLARGDLMERWRLIGVTSFGPKNCGTKGVPGVLSRVRHYIDWILDNASL